MIKKVKTILPRPRAHWVGDGFNVFPVFADRAFTEELSPFLMFDYAAPKEFKPTHRRLGVGQHPHRGFETVTIAFQGEVEHADSLGNGGVIGPGDVQWMTAARGIIHEEFHSKSFAKAGGVLEMCQLWLNLPASHKMNAPRYQPILRGDIPEIPLRPFGGEAKKGGGSTAGGEAKDRAQCSADDLDDTLMTHGSVRIIAGSIGSTEGPASTATPVNMWDIRIRTVGQGFEFECPEGHNVIVFTRGGRISVQGQELGPQDVAILDQEGSTIVIEAIEPDSKVLLLGGEPLNEPIAAQGPFVMNTREELRQAMLDYRTGRFA